MKKIKAIFFDLYGTLILSHDITAAWKNWSTAFYDRMVECGLSMPKEEFRPYSERLFEAPKPDFVDEEQSLFERRVRELGAKFGLELDKEHVGRIVEDVIKVWHKDMFLDSEAHDVLKALKSGFRLALITNWEHTPWIYKMLSEMELEAYFENVIISDEVGVAKPDPRIFHIALERTNLKHDEVAYVGDSQVDVKGAINAGVYPILVVRNETSKRQDHTSDDHSILRALEKEDIPLDEITIIRRLSELPDIFCFQPNVR